MSLMLRFILVVWILALSTVPSLLSAEDRVSVELEASSTTPLVGQQILLTLRVHAPLGAEIQWPDLPIIWGPLEILNHGELRETVENADVFREQDFLAVLWSPGDFATPPLKLVWRLNKDSGDSSLEIPVVYFSVPSILNGSEEELRPYRHPVSLPELPVPLMAFGLAGAGLMSLILWRAWRHQRLASPDLIANQSVSPSARVFLERVRAARVGLALRPADLVVTASDQLFLYIRVRFGPLSTGATTTELLGMIAQDVQLTHAQRTDCERLLSRAELVKYAALEPSVVDAEQFVVRAQRWVLAVEESRISQVQ